MPSRLDSNAKSPVIANGVANVGRVGEVVRVTVGVAVWGVTVPVGVGVIVAVT